MQTQSQNNPISNLMYDWITILQSKAEGVTAYEKYMKDAQMENSQECLQLLERLRTRDIEMVQEVKDHLSMMMAQQGSSQNTARMQSTDTEMPEATH